MLIGGALVNALAFSGSNYVFSQFSDHGKSEQKRHNLAVEREQKDRDEWNKKRQDRLDFINEKLREQNAAHKYLKNLDAAMLEYYRVTSQRLPPLPPEPQLSDYYHPSEDQKTAELAFIIGGITITGILAYKYL